MWLLTPKISFGMWGKQMICEIAGRVKIIKPILKPLLTPIAVEYPQGNPELILS